MKEFYVYTVMRLLLFAGAFVIVFGIWAGISSDTVNGFLVLVIAFLISGVVSYFVLDRYREALALRVQERAARATARLEERRSAEDVDD